MMEIAITVDNISQIRQIAESLPGKPLSGTALDNGTDFELPSEYVNIPQKKENISGPEAAKIGMKQRQPMSRIIWNKPQSLNKKSMNTATFEANNPRSAIPAMAKDERGSLATGGTPVNGPGQAATINCNEGVETTCTFKEALNEKNVYVKPLANEPIGGIRNFAAIRCWKAYSGVWP